MTSTRTRARKRRRSLGAAMVEGAVIMPVMVTLWGIIIYTGGSRYAKQSLEHRARQAIFTYATRACEGDVSVSPEDGPTLPDIGQAEGADPSSAAGEEGRAAVNDLSASQKFFTTSGTLRGEFTRFGYSTNMRHKSFYFCNERSRTGVFAFLQYAIDLARQLLPF